MASDHLNPLEPTPTPPEGDEVVDPQPADEAATRATLDAQIASGGDVPINVLQDALRALIVGEWGEIDDTLRAMYFKRGVEYALDSHDAEMSLMIARAMDASPELDAQLWAWLYENIGKQPDSVYAFIRARLSQTDADDAIFARWQPRLKSAAQVSLQVAITDGDWQTITDWLKLIGREPAAYDLSDVFIRGIQLAQPRAHNEPDLAVALFVLTARRHQATFDALIEDQALIAALADDNLRVSLADGNGDGIALMSVYGADIFLLAIQNATEARNPAMLTSAAIEQVWTLRNSGTHQTGDHTPERLIEAWIRDGAEWLHEDTLKTLLRLSLTDRRDELFHRLIFALKNRPDLILLTAQTLHKSGRSVSDGLALISQMVANEDLTLQGAVDTYSVLLRLWDFDKSSVLMMAQLIRAIQHHPELQVEPWVLWRILDSAAETREDLIARVASKRLTSELEALEDDTMFAEGLLHLQHKISWNSVARSQVITWWRGFVRAQTAARLSRIEKALEAQKSDKTMGDREKAYQELREVMQTIIAVRRMVGKRTLEQFADAVGVAYDVLQAFAESFDPSPKRSANFDVGTIRAEFEARAEELSPHARKILANNFKDLAALIAEMGDNRSKASLRRRTEEVDRALMTGDQAPHSAVDALKWFSGYLSGAQDNDNDNDPSNPNNAKKNG